MIRRVLVVALAWLALAAHAGALGPDGVPGRPIPGKFIWFDLATENLPAARVFYREVFGWTFTEAVGAPAGYTLIENGKDRIGGMFEMARPQGARVGARWISLISVADPESAARTVRSRGGEVLVAPRRVAGRGTHAVFRDPQGAVFGVLASSGGDPLDDPVVDGDVYWLDLFTPDPAAAGAFYADVAGYQVGQGRTNMGPPRWYLVTGSVARAGIVAQMGQGLAPAWLPYILVNDVAGTVARAQKAGGKVLVAPDPNRLNGKLAVIADPHGGIVGVVDAP
jgi:predicted enzyme related to lactoylglutathione lyase